MSPRGRRGIRAEVHSSVGRSDERNGPYAMLLYVALQGLLPQRIAAAADQLASSHAWLAVSRLDRDLCLLETHPHAADDFSVRATPITRFIALLATRFHPSLLQSLITVSVRPVAASIESVATAAMTGQLARYDQSLLPSNPPPPPPSSSSSPQPSSFHSSLEPLC